MQPRRILLSSLPIAAIVAVAAVAVSLPSALWQPDKVVELPGVVESHPIRLGSKVGGRVAAVNVTEGQTVEADQVLVELETPELSARTDQCAAALAGAKAELAMLVNGPRTDEKSAAEAAVDAARARLEKLEAGARIEDISRARSHLEAIEAEVRLAQEQFDRVERLFGRSAASESEFFAKKTALERSRATQAAAKAELERLVSGNRQEEIAEAAAELKRLEAEYRLLAAGAREEEVTVAEAHVEELAAKCRELEASREEATIRAPCAALVEVISVRAGELVEPGQHVLRLLHPDDLWVRVFVPETELGRIRMGQAVKVSADSNPVRSFDGTIIHIASEAEFTPRNVQSADERRHQVFGVKVRVDESQHIFKTGMAAHVSLVLGNTQ